MARGGWLVSHISRFSSKILPGAPRIQWGGPLNDYIVRILAGHASGGESCLATKLYDQSVTEARLSSVFPRDSASRHGHSSGLEGDASIGVRCSGMDRDLVRAARRLSPAVEP